MGWIILVLGLVGVAYLALRKPRLPAGQTSGFAKIRGPGKFACEVVGESQYAAAFHQLLGPKAGTEEELFGDALLRLEDSNPYDDQAVAVFIEGQKVGYLSRQMARDFRAALARDRVAGRAEYAVAARVYGGGKDEIFSVQLDLPLQ